MRPQTKKYLIALVLPISVLAIAFGFGAITETQFQLLGGVTIGLVGFHYIYKRKWFSDKVEEWEEEMTTDSVSNSIGVKQAKQQLIEFSEDEYHGDQKISFQWSDLILQTTVEKHPQTGDEYMFYAFITVGENNRKVLVVIEGENGEIVTHMPVLWQGMLRNPFQYSEFVQEIRKNKFKSSNAFDDYQGTGQMGGRRGGGAQWQPMYQAQRNRGRVGGMMGQPQMEQPYQGQPGSSQDNEEGDENKE